MITIYGASDDLVEVDGCEGADEFGTDDWSAILTGPGATEQMFVRCWYELTGTWQVGIGQVDESVPLPPWPVRIRQGPRPASRPDRGAGLLRGAGDRRTGRRAARDVQALRIQLARGPRQGDRTLRKAVTRRGNPDNSRRSQMTKETKVRELHEQLNDIAPYPTAKAEATAAAVTRYLASRALYRGQSFLVPFGPEMSPVAVARLVAEYAAAHALDVLATADPERADATAAAIWAAWEDGESSGRWLWTILGDEAARKVTALGEQLGDALGSEPAPVAETPGLEHSHRPNGFLEPAGPCLCCNQPAPGIPLSDEAVAILAGEGIVPVRQDDLRAVLAYAEHFDVADDPAVGRLELAAAWQGMSACEPGQPSGVATRTVTRLSLTAALRAVLPFSVDAELTDKILAALPEGIPHA